MITPRNNPEQTFKKFFWPNYPRHDDKQNALKVWCALDPDDHLIAVILEALAWQRVSPQWTKVGGAFVPYPSTYLRRKRWTDEQPAAPHVEMTRLASLGTHRVIK